MDDLLNAIWDNLTPTLGNFFVIDLIAATTNAFNGALLARRPTHYRGYTVMGVLLLAVFGGIGGGVSRDVLLNDVPAPLINPWYIGMAAMAAGLALYLDFSSSQKVRESMFRFMAAFSLPWFAVVGADKTLEAGLPPMAALAIGVTAATTGRFLIDITSGVTPKHFIRGEWFIGTALLASAIYIPLWYAGVSIWPASLIAAGAGFAFRFLALHYKWEEPEPLEPATVAVASASSPAPSAGSQPPSPKRRRTPKSPHSPQ